MAEVNERKLWDQLDAGNKSYTVRVMNFFHYRRNRIGQSWKREEVLTWELIRALEILPKEFFLVELLLYIKQSKKKLAHIAEELLKEPINVKVVAYPKLNLLGNKQNSASDIELSLGDCKLWIEAKTALITKEELSRQIEIQKKALARINNNSKYAVIALIPNNQDCDTPFMRWSELLKIFETALNKMEDKYKGGPIIAGYRMMAEELIGRISSRFET